MTEITKHIFYQGWGDLKQGLETGLEHSDCVMTPAMQCLSLQRLGVPICKIGW